MSAALTNSSLAGKRKTLGDKMTPRVRHPFTRREQTCSTGTLPEANPQGMVDYQLR